ncbi:hypothetical protein JMUB7518_28190 [Staphylococcus aureus]
MYINYELQEQLTNKAYIGDHIYVEGIWLEVQADGLNVLSQNTVCLLYTSDAADELDGVDLGGRRIIKKKTL